MRALVVAFVLAAASRAGADASVPHAAATTARADACRARMDDARARLAAQPGFARARLRVDSGRNPATPARDDWEITVSASVGAHEVSAMVGIGNSGQWSFYPRDRWFDNARMWHQSFRQERYGAGDHEIAAIIEADRVPRPLARTFVAIVRAAIDDCLAMPR
jgi:hypothetical protein